MQRPGALFAEQRVVDAYRHRPAYPDAVYDKLADLCVRRESMLDLGCGTGKMCRPLSKAFRQVTAIDPSRAMLDQARRLENGDAPNIAWVQGLAEEADLVGAPFDLIVAAASIHWMDHARLFPRLLDHARPDHVFAVVSGDGAYRPPWHDAWEGFMARWIREVKGEEYLPGGAYPFFRAHEPWIAAEGKAHFLSDPVVQTVADFVACQHSRDTFAYTRLGDRAAAFDRELTDLLNPHVVKGRLTYTVRVRVTWGKIRPSPAD